jgi:hypothetical protein
VGVFEHGMDHAGRLVGHAPAHGRYGAGYRVRSREATTRENGTVEMANAPTEKGR